MLKQAKPFVLFFLALLVQACIEEFNYQNPDNQALLVVEGYISDKPGLHVVNISRSSESVNERSEKISGAIVRVMDDRGQEVSFFESQPGEYIVTDTLFMAEPERAYHLLVDVGGSSYTSEVVALPQSLKIDSVSWIPTRFDIHDATPGVNLSLRVTTDQNSTATQYYQYDVFGTYEVRPIMPDTPVWNVDRFIALREEHNMVKAQFHIRPVDRTKSTYLLDIFELAPPELVKIGYLTDAYVFLNPYNLFPDPQSLKADVKLLSSELVEEEIDIWDMTSYRTRLHGVPKVCWAHSEQKGARIFNLKSRTVNQIKDETIFHVKCDLRLANLYSANVRQYALSEEYYQFINLSKKFTINNEELYQVQPGFVQGNIRNVADDNEKVIGFFHATSIDEKRLFISLLQLPSVERLSVLFDFPTYEYESDEFVFPAIDTLNDRILYIKENDFEQYWFLRTLQLASRSKAIKYLFSNWGSSEIMGHRIYNYVPESIPDFLYGKFQFGGGFPWEGLFLYPDYCFDCSQFADPQKPEYWPDSIGGPFNNE